MPNNRITALAAVLFASTLIACGNVGDAPEATTGDAVIVSEDNGGPYAIDTTRSTITWKAAKVTRSHDGGFRQFAGTIGVIGDSVTAVRVTIETPSIFADEEKLATHLRSDDFFKVDEYPTAAFEADIFARIDSGGYTHMVTGNLTMLGVTKAVTFPAKIERRDSVVSASGDFIINRKDWNILYAGALDDLINDDVRIMLDIVAVKSEPVAVL